MPNPHSITSLEQALSQKRQQLFDLVAQRNELLKRISKLDTKMTALAGSPSDSYMPTTRPKNTKSLMTCIIEVLTNSKDPMTAGELADAVTAMGYVSTARDLKPLIRTQICGDDRVGKSERGRFVLVGKPKTGGKIKKARKKKTKK